MTGHASNLPQSTVSNPIAREPDLLGRLTTFRDHVHERLFDQLAADVLKDSTFHAAPNPLPPEEVRAMALALRVLTKPEWNADDLRLFDACWNTASRADLFAERFEADRNHIEQQIAAARAEKSTTSWVGKVSASGRSKGAKRAAAPRKAVDHTPQTPSASGAPSGPVRCLTADAGNDTVVVLIEDDAHGQLQIAFEKPDGLPKLTGPVQEFLRENGFEADPAGGGCLWGRPLNPASTFQDRIDGEWVVFRAAEMMQTARRGRR